MELCKTDALRQECKILNISNDKRGAKISRIRGGAKNAIQNMVLVTCLIGRLCNLAIPNTFLETLTITAKHSKRIFYDVREEFSRDGVIKLEGEGYSQQIMLTELGLRRASRLLTGEEEDNPKWEDIRESARKHLWILWPPMMGLKGGERDNILRALLMLYSPSQGNVPEDFYRNLMLNVRNHYSQCGSLDDFYRELVSRLIGLYSTLGRIYRGKKSDGTEKAEAMEALIASRQLIINFIVALHKHLYTVYLKTSIACLLGFRKYLRSSHIR